MKGLIGKKSGMTQVFNDEGNVVPVSVIDTSSLEVVGKRTLEKDKYTAVVLGLVDAKEKHLTKAQAGSFKKAGAKAKRIVREFRVDATELASFNVGEGVKVDALFKKGDLVDVTGITKGRGTSGVMRRHNFKGQRATHGVKKVHRHGGSTGNNTWPARVWKGKRMAGRYGAEQSTMRNIKVVRVDAENNLLLVHGAVPGPVGGYVLIKGTNMVR